MFTSEGGSILEGMSSWLSRLFASSLIVVAPRVERDSVILGNRLKFNIYLVTSLMEA